MGLDSLLARLESRMPDTPDTPCNPAGVSAKPLQHKACTPDTPDTPQNCNGRGNAPKAEPERHRRWWITYPDGSVDSLTCTPPATGAEIVARYPGAVVAEPVEPTREPRRHMTR